MIIIPPDIGSVILESAEKVVIEIIFEKAPDLYRYLRDLPKRERREAFKELKSTVDSQSVATVIGQVEQQYPHTVGLIAAQSGEGVLAQWRTFIVPRFLVNEIALSDVRGALDDSAEFNRLKDKPKVRELFFIWLVNELDRELSTTKASPDSPKEVGQGWSIIGFDSTFVWDAKEWAGHYYTVRKKPEEIAHSSRKHTLKRHMAELSGQLGRYPLAKVNEHRTEWKKWLTHRDQKLALVSIPFRADVL